MKNIACTLIVPLILIGIITAAFVDKSPGKLLFKERKYIRSSFCLYNDGKFYSTQASGCIGQAFSWGYWKALNDTVTLSYSAQNIFRYDIIKSADSQSNFQIIRIVDCYNQPVRFQLINHDSGYNNLYNIGYLRIKKGNAINYPAPMFDRDEEEWISIVSNADTITYQWQCNRESIESINGGSLFVDRTSGIKKVVLRDKSVLWLN